METWSGSGLAAWIWLALGFVLLAAEMLMPGMVLLWFGVGGVMAGLVFLLWPGWELGAQALVWAGLSLLGLVVLRRPVRDRLARRAANRGPGPVLNDRAGALIGHELILSTPLAAGEGWARVGDSPWSVTGPDLPAGARVRVVAVTGNVLTVVPAE